MLLLIDLLSLAATLSALYSRRSTAMASIGTNNMHKAIESVDEKFTFFYESTDPFSNFYECQFRVEGKVFRSVAEFFHFKKAGMHVVFFCCLSVLYGYCVDFSVFFDDKIGAAQILNSTHPSVQKRLGRHVSNFNREKWLRVSKSYMKIGCFAKVRCRFSPKGFIPN